MDLVFITILICNLCKSIIKFTVLSSIYFCIFGDITKVKDMSQCLPCYISLYTKVWWGGGGAGGGGRYVVLRINMYIYN